MITESAFTKDLEGLINRELQKLQEIKEITDNPVRIIDIKYQLVVGEILCYSAMIIYEA